jgi:hypothetical protein
MDMKRFLFIIVSSLVLHAQNVQLKGRVYQTGHPESGIPGVTVALKITGEADRTKLTGENGVYSFDPVKRGKGMVTFTKKSWQPDPRNEPVDLTPAVVQLNVDLFQPGATTITQLAEWKVQFINTAVQSDPASASAVFASQWRTCQDAEIPVRQRVLCAQTLSKNVNPAVTRPAPIQAWAGVDSQKLNYLEGVSSNSLWTTGQFDFGSLNQTGLPSDVVYAHFVYELDKSPASDEVKRTVQFRLNNQFKGYLGDIQASKR